MLCISTYHSLRLYIKHSNIYHWDLIYFPGPVHHRHQRRLLVPLEYSYMYCVCMYIAKKGVNSVFRETEGHINSLESLLFWFQKTCNSGAA